MGPYPQEGVIRVRWCFSGEIVDADRNGFGYGLLYFSELRTFIMNGGIVVEEGKEDRQWTVEYIDRINPYHRC